MLIDFLSRKKENASYYKILRDVARGMVQLNRPERLLQMVTHFVDREFGLTHTSLLVLEQKKKQFIFADSRGRTRIPVGLVKMEMDHPLILWFQKEKNGQRQDDYLSRAEIEKLLSKRSLQPAAKEELARLDKALSDLKIELAVPGYYQQSLLGLFLLGRRWNKKPFKESEIDFFQILIQDCSMAVKAAEHQQHLIEKNQELEKRLQEIEALRKKEREIFYQIMRSLAQEVHAKDPYTFGHINQVERLGLMVAKEMGLEMTGRRKDILSAGLILHDVGKIGIPDSVLKKPGKLDAEEWKIMKTHVEKGAQILEHLTDFQEAAEIVLSHHENFDGSGYPRGLKGDQIPLEARIVSVVDAFHAIVSTRCYSKARPVEVAFEELKRCAGTQFDPQVVDAFIWAMKREMKKRGVGFFLEDEKAALLQA